MNVTREPFARLLNNAQFNSSFQVGGELFKQVPRGEGSWGKEKEGTEEGWEEEKAPVVPPLNSLYSLPFVRIE